MLLLAHTGLTLGIARGLDELLLQHPSSSRLCRWSRKLIDKVDYRLVLIGSLLPDIIDKPVGIYLFRETFSNGRIFGHTLLFLLFLFLLGLYLRYRFRWSGGLILCFCSTIHLLLDGMWSDPQTFLWPFYGLAFEKEDLALWIPHMLLALKTQPRVYVPECLGAICLVGFGVELVLRREVPRFLKTGLVGGK